MARMADEASACAACGKTRDTARMLVQSGAAALCDECVRRFDDALSSAIDEESRRRGSVSESVMAEELALNLMDALDASRSDDGYEWKSPAPEPEPEPEDVG